VTHGAALLAGLALLLGAAAGHADPAASCTTVDRAPASTSESLVLGLRTQLLAGSEEGVRKFMDTGQVIFLRGGHPVDVLLRHPAQGTVLVRHGEHGLPLWTLDGGVACTAAPDPKGG
jgi:hypothetical protein